MSTSTSKSTSPPEDDLVDAIRPIRQAHPSLGAAKLLELLLQSHGDWAVSEKRLRKVLQKTGLITLANSSHHESVSRTPAIGDVGPPHNEGDVQSAPTINSDGTEQEFPSWSLNAQMDPTKWTKTVDVKVISDQKGKGLVARGPINSGEHIWVEDPFVFSPEWELEKLQLSGHACAYCTKPVASSTMQPAYCTRSCGSAFCNRLCSARGASVHAFLCPIQNPACIPFVQHVRAQKWKAPLAWARVTALLLSLAAKASDPSSSASKDLGNALSIVRGLAALSLEKRVKVLPGWQASYDDSCAMWRKTHTLFVQALSIPPDPKHLKALQKLRGNASKYTGIKRLEAELFTWDGFMVGLGKMGLNMEAYGGIYALHSHVNHSCDPNISVRHITANQVSRITIISRRDITNGEELTATYVNPSGDLWTRRRELKEWGFGNCMCDRCRTEEEEARRRGDFESEGSAAKKAELEDELRDFLRI